MTDPITAPIRLCIVCDRPRDGGRLSCADPGCIRAVALMPVDELRAIRTCEAIEAMRRGGPTYIHLSPR